MAALNAFSVLGIRVRIDPSWFIAFLLFAWLLSAAYFPFQIPDYSRFTYWTFGTLSSLLLFGSVLVHELSHCMVARQLGMRAEQITLFIFGGVSEIASHSATPASEFKISVAGPLASLGIGAVFGIIAILVGNFVDRIVLETLRYLAFVNVALAVFNLIPGFPLDGGRVLRSLLWYRTGNLHQATRNAVQGGVIFALALMAFGFVSILWLQVVPGLWMILIGLFLKKSAEAEYQSFEVRTGLQDTRLQDVMTPPVGVERSTPISEFISDYVFRYHQREFPVLDSNRFVGMVDLRSTKSVPSSEWPFVPVGEHLAPSSSYCVLDPDIEAGEALALLTRAKCSRAPVVKDGVLVGVLTPDDLLRVISLKRDLAA